MEIRVTPHDRRQGWVWVGYDRDHGGWYWGRQGPYETEEDVEFLPENTYAAFVDFVEAIKGVVNWSRHRDVLAKLHTADMLERSLKNDELAAIVRDTFHLRVVAS
jgi:hypothetical protein